MHHYTQCKVEFAAILEPYYVVKHFGVVQYTILHHADIFLLFYCH